MTNGPQQQHPENGRHGDHGSEVVGAGSTMERQPDTASERRRHLTTNLMDLVVDRENLGKAAKRVRANAGAPGVDGMKADELKSWMDAYEDTLIHLLRNDQYYPQPIRGVEIPKDGGGVRQLGIPTVIDRLVQQAIAQVLEPIYEPRFSDFSFGFRPGRSAHDALKRASGYVAEGYSIVVDIDLAKYFDTINHDILMSRLARSIGDKTLLRLIRRFLQAGMMRDGVVSDREEGTPQGGPLSPLLANIMLDELDVELELRGHKFCRYADDCNIYVRSLKAGERVMKSVERLLEGELRLKINRDKSAVAPVAERKFLGFRIGEGGKLEAAPRSIEKAKKRIREITSRRRGVSFKHMLDDLRKFLIGWGNYFRIVDVRWVFGDLDRWIRRRVRAYRLCQTQRKPALLEFLKSRGVVPKQARQLASSGKGWWRLSIAPQSNKAMPNKWLASEGLVNLAERFGGKTVRGTAV